MELKKALELILAAWRHYDDENDLAAFDNYMDAAIKICDAVPSCYHDGIVKALFGETPEEQEVSTDG